MTDGRPFQDFTDTHMPAIGPDTQRPQNADALEAILHAKRMAQRWRSGFRGGVACSSQGSSSPARRRAIALWKSAGYVLEGTSGDV